MDRRGEGDTRNPSSTLTETQWLEKKRTLLKRLAEERSPQKVDMADLSRERERVLSDIRRLEEENHFVARSVREFDIQLSKRRRTFQTLTKKSDGTKQKLVEFLAMEHNLLSEIESYESERETLSGVYSEVSEGLRTKISALENTVNDIGFVKGEARAFMEKVEMLEGEVPAKSRDMDDLDAKLLRSAKALKDLYNGMHAAEKSVKTNYYKKKNSTRE